MPETKGQSFELPKARRRSDLFTTQESRDDAQREKVQEIPLDLIDDFPGHPFHVRQDEAMESMVESVRKSGVLTPAVRMMNAMSLSAATAASSPPPSPGWKPCP